MEQRCHCSRRFEENDAQPGEISIRALFSLLNFLLSALSPSTTLNPSKDICSEYLNVNEIEN
jgi:hypothetical protein